MAPISTAALLWLVMRLLMIIKVTLLRTVWPFATSTWHFIMYSVGGMDLPLILPCLTMWGSQTCLFQEANTTWLMLAFQHVTSFLFHTEVFNTTLQSGAESISGKKGIITLDETLTYQLRLSTLKELFNLQHASTCNIIECICGVLKQQFHILVHPPEYNMDVQAHLPPALAPLHNFIHMVQMKST